MIAVSALSFMAQVQNCPQGTDANACLTTLPQVAADSVTLTAVLSIIFGVIGAVTVLIIIIQGIRFILSNGEPQKAADARRGILYAAIGLGVVVSAEIIVNFVIGKL